MIELKNLRDGILQYEKIEVATNDIDKFIGYIDSINHKDKNGKDLTFGIQSEDFLKLYKKYKNIGILIDGVNSTIAGFNKVFITWVGYKNKVLSVYPESTFDAQLVRESDDFEVSKKSGMVIYNHKIADPFSSNKGIIGAYCVIKNKRGEFLETLGSDDFEKMKETAMLSKTWDKWESEFWLKSVIKRACKRHFNDIVSEIEKVDNEDYNLSVEATDEEFQAIVDAHQNDN